jgi:predicted nucleotidyltransferase
MSRSCPGNEDRLYGEEIGLLEAEGYDFELADACLIAIDASRMISTDTQRHLREILDADALMEELTHQIIVSTGPNNPAHVHRCEALVRNLRTHLRSRNS